MSRTGLYDCHLFYIFLDDFMRNSNFDIGVYMLKSNIDVFFCDVIPVLAQVFIVSSNRVS